MNDCADQRRSDALLTRCRRLLTTRNICWRLLRPTEHYRLCKELQNVYATVGESDWHNTYQRNICAVLHSALLGTEERQAGRTAGKTCVSTDDVLNSPRMGRSLSVGLVQSSAELEQNNSAVSYGASADAFNVEVSEAVPTGQLSLLASAGQKISTSTIVHSKLDYYTQKAT